MSDIPTISVTNESQDTLSEGEISDCDMKDGVTDVEDFDDGLNVVDKGLKVLTKSRKVRSSPATTDIEDFTDSSSEEEEIKDTSEEKPISLADFLVEGVMETNDAAANKTTITTTHKKSALFTSLLSEDQGPVTDCEHYDSSGDENSNDGIEVSIPISAFFIDSASVNISDVVFSKNHSDEEDNVSVLSASDAGDICNPDEISEAEDLTLSDIEDETIYKKLCSEVKVLSKGGIPVEETATAVEDEPPTHSLRVPQIQEEFSTDTEGIDMDSDAELGEATSSLVIENSEPSARRHSLTDVEDLDIGDISDFIPEPKLVSESSLPPPVREITVVKSDVSGQRITNTMPLQDNLCMYLGLDANVDKGLTDVEDLSTDEDFYKSPTNTVIDQIPEYFRDAARNIEVIKDTTTIQLQVIENEPTTDIEEIFMPGTARRKRNSKPKGQAKNKKLSQVKCQEQHQSVTDVEDIDVSDAEGARQFQNKLKIPSIITPGHRTPDIKTDVEYLSGDDELSVSEGEEPSQQIVDAINATSFYSTETTIESVFQPGSPCPRKETKVIRRTMFENTAKVENPNLTDVEDVNLQSDVEDSHPLNTFSYSYSRAETVSPIELQDALNESSVSIVHEKCGSAFDIDKERQHIKGLRDIADANTDVEYIEEENDIEEIERPLQVDDEFKHQLDAEYNKEDYENIRKEALTLVDSILEQSVIIVSGQQCNDTYNSESDHYAITCDVNGIDMVKSPTIESLSGKSFDDNISVNDDSNIKMTPCTSTTNITTTTSTLLQPTTSSSLIVEKFDRNDNNGDDVFDPSLDSVRVEIIPKSSIDQEINDNDQIADRSDREPIYEQAQTIDSNRTEQRFERIERKFERLSSQLDDIEESANCFDKEFDNLLSRDDVSNLQSDFSKISWDESASGTTTAADVGLGTPDNDLQDLPTEPASQMLETTTTDSDIPKPTPRTRRSIVGEVVGDDDEHSISQAEKTVEQVDFKHSKQFWESLESQSQSEPQATPPIPKPRMQVKIADDSIDSQKGSSHGSKVSSEQQVEYSETSSIQTFTNDDKCSPEDDSEISDARIEDELCPNLDMDKSESKSAEVQNFDQSEKPVEVLGEATDDEDSENAPKPQASFYIGESSTNIITKSTTDKRQDYAFDNKGYEGYSEDEPLTKQVSKTKVIHSKSVDESSSEYTKSAVPEQIDPVQKHGDDECNEEKPYVLSVDIPAEEDISENKLFRQDSETRNDILETSVDNDETDSNSKRSNAVQEPVVRKPLVSESYDTQQIHYEDQTIPVQHVALQADVVSHMVELVEEKIRIHELGDLVEQDLTYESPIEAATHTQTQELEEDSLAQKETPKLETTEAEKDEKVEQKTRIEPKLDLNLEKSELEPSEKSFAKVKDEDISTSFVIEQKPILSPIKPFKGFTTYQETSDGFMKMLLIDPSQVDQSMVDKTFDEVQESLEAVEEELMEVVKDGKLIKQSPSEFEFKLLPHIKYTSDPIHESHQEDVEKQEKHSTDEYPSLSSADESSSKGEIVHRLKKESQKDSLNRWSVPDMDHSSSGDSHYQSFEKTDSRPLSSDIENLMTYGNSSEYQTALDASLLPSTEYVSAVSTLDHSGKTISSHESMKSLDSETSANLGSMEVSEISETLVPSVTDPDMEREIQEQDEEDFDVDDSEVKLSTLEDKFCGVLMEDYQKTDDEIPSLMKRSHEMTFQADISQEAVEEAQTEAVPLLFEQTKEPVHEREDTQAWRYGASIDDSRLSEELKFASSLEDGSVLSMSLSSASCVDTVVDLAGSYGSSSLAGAEVLIRDDYTGTSFEEPSKTEKIDSMVMTSSMGKEDETNYANTQITTVTVSSEATETDAKRKGHKRSESTSISNTDFLKDLSLVKATESPIEEELPVEKSPERPPAPVCHDDRGDSGSESDYDAYESEYSRSFKAPTSQKKSKDKRVETYDKDQEPEKRPFTPSQSVSEAIIEDIAEEIETMRPDEPSRRPSQNMQDYSNIPDITVTEDLQKYSEEEDDEFQDNVLYKAKTQEELDKKEDDTPIHYAQEQMYSVAEDQYQELIQRDYESKLADITTKFARHDDEEKADSPDSFEMLEQPDISDEFVIIEEVAKEAHEHDPEGKSIKIQNVKYVKRHDEEVEQILVKSAPAAPNAGSTLYREDLNFEFEESPPMDKDQDAADAAAASKRWVEMQLSDNAAHLRYPYEMERGILEDIKEEDTEFEVGSSRISSFKDSFSSTPEYDVLAGRKYFTREHDNISMSSLQEFESLEQAISLENRRAHQGSQDSLSNGSFTKRYMARSAGQGDDISMSSLKEFEGLENACLEAHLIEIKAKEEAALLSRSDESNKSSNGEGKPVSTTTVTTVTATTNVSQMSMIDRTFSKAQQDIETLLRAKLDECEEDASNIMEVSTDSLDLVLRKPKSPSGNGKDDSQPGSCDSLEINKSGDIMTSSLDSFEISKDATARSSRSDVDSLEQQILQDVRRDSIDSIELEYALRASKMDRDSLEEPVTKMESSSTSTTTIVQGPLQTITRVVTTTISSGSQQSQLCKDISNDSLNLNPAEVELLLSSTGSLDHTSSTATNATYQNENDSQMSGSMTSCGSNTLIDTVESNFPDMYQASSSSVITSTTTTSQATSYDDSRLQQQFHQQSQHQQEYTRDGEKRYDYFEIFEKDSEKDMQKSSKKGGDSSQEPERSEEQGK